MIQQTYSDIVTDELAEGAIINEDYDGFPADYLVLHCLLRKYNPASVFEVGTNCGVGTNIICNAVPEAKVYSLDLPTELAHVSLQSPMSEGKGDRVGGACLFPYTQIRDNSMTYDYSSNPCEAYYLDGEHTEVNVTHETKQVLKCNPKLIAFHDSDMPQVMAGILAGMGKNKKYKLYRVAGTRVSYLLKK